MEMWKNICPCLFQGCKGLYCDSGLSVLLIFQILGLNKAAYHALDSYMPRKRPGKLLVVGWGVWHMSVNYLIKIFQGSCHNYTHKRGQTGGWTDVFCEHLTKVGSKMMAVQETVSDSYDIMHSLKKLPIVHMMDDSCAYVRHSFSRNKVLAELAFGKTHGCYEMPDERKEPTQGVDCPAITPLSFSLKTTNKEAMENPSTLVHPDAKELTRYCLGTRLQMRAGKSSHKLKTCAFHDVNLGSQGKLLKSMTQEALQVAE